MGLLCFPIARLFVVTTDCHGKIGSLASGSSSGSTVGAVTVQFQPSSDFVGDFVVMGRSFGHSTSDPITIPFAPIPYRRISINNAASDYTLGFASISTTALILIPSTGLEVGVMINCIAGSCRLIPNRLDGCPAI